MCAAHEGARRRVVRIPRADAHVQFRLQLGQPAVAVGLGENRRGRDGHVARVGAVLAQHAHVRGKLGLEARLEARRVALDRVDLQAINDGTRGWRWQRR